MTPPTSFLPLNSKALYEAAIERMGEIDLKRSATRTQCLRIISEARMPISHGDVVRAFPEDQRNKVSILRALRSLHDSDVVAFAYGGYLPTPVFSGDVVAVLDEELEQARVIAMSPEQSAALRSDVAGFGEVRRITVEVLVRRPSRTQPAKA